MTIQIEIIKNIITHNDNTYLSTCFHKTEILNTQVLLQVLSLYTLCTFAPDSCSGNIP